MLTTGIDDYTVWIWVNVHLRSIYKGYIHRSVSNYYNCSLAKKEHAISTYQQPLIDNKPVMYYSCCPSKYASTPLDHAILIILCLRRSNTLFCCLNTIRWSRLCSLNFWYWNYLLVFINTCCNTFHSSARHIKGYILYNCKPTAAILFFFINTQQAHQTLRTTEPKYGGENLCCRIFVQWVFKMNADG